MIPNADPDSGDNVTWMASEDDYVARAPEIISHWMRPHKSELVKNPKIQKARQNFGGT